MDTVSFRRIEHVVRSELTAEQLVLIELAARETNAEQAVAALLGEKSLDLGKSRLCPLCGAGNTVKNGRDRRGLQRFLCRSLDCLKSFTAVTGTPLSGMRMPHKWLEFSQTLIDKRSLSWVKEHLGISRKTGLAWRKRLLGSSTELPADMLSGIIEADETYFLQSFKGHRGWKKGAPPVDRPPRYRGSGAVKTGLSSEHVPVVTALDNSNHLVQGVLPQRTDSEIVALLVEQVDVGSLICSDGHSSYPKLADARSCEHRTIKRPIHSQEDKERGLPKGRPGALGLGRVNAYHQTIKISFNGIFKGVSTRYLPNYLALAKHIRNGLAPIVFIQTAIA